MQTYLEKWHLSDAQEIAKTHTSDVYKVRTADGGFAVLKYLNEVGQRDEAGGAVLLQYYGGDGAVKLLKADEKAHLLEFADGSELAEMVKAGDDNKATYIMCDVIKALHKKRTDSVMPKTLVPLKTWFQDLYAAARSTNQEIVIEAAHIADDLFTTTAQEIPLHGDMHHHNILSSERGWLAIDPKGLIGDPCYDLANFYGNPVGMEDLYTQPARIKEMTDIFVSELGYPRERILKFVFVHNVISTIWDGCTVKDIEARLCVARGVKALI